MDDDDFVSGLMHSGIPLAQLDSAFAGKSCGRLNKLLAVFWKVPHEVARELALLFGGKEIADAKFKRTSSPSLSVLASLELLSSVLANLQLPARALCFLLMRQSHTLSWSLPLLTTSWQLRDQSIAPSLSEGEITNAP